VKPFTDAPRPSVLDLLKVHGPSDVPALARRRGVNRTAVREQLNALEREGLVARRVVRRGRRGRPSHVYELTAKADALFPQAYGPLALSLLRQIRETEGDGKIDRLLERRTRELAKEYRARLEGLPPARRWKELARIRAEEGYMARPCTGGFSEHHCPIAAIAKEFPQVCRQEKVLFERVLGGALERTEHLASGDKACSYRRKTTP
jgi:predicted ArsR family transcriptional regulator